MFETIELDWIIYDLTSIPNYQLSYIFNNRTYGMSGRAICKREAMAGYIGFDSSDITGNVFETIKLKDSNDNILATGKGWVVNNSGHFKYRIEGNIK